MDEIIYYNESLTLLTMGYARFPSKRKERELCIPVPKPAMQRLASTQTPKIRNQIKTRRLQQWLAIAHRVPKTQEKRNCSSRKDTSKRCAITQILDQILHTAKVPAH
jgi:hypothetical protein